jgi:monovalent cation:H+ antiporter-2, CPA2 family
MRKCGMPHDTGLIATVTIALALAFVFGLIATRLHVSAIVGYLLAGVAVGPFTPGFVADTHLAPQLAELGVILLMFGVGIHFSIRDLLAVKVLAIPGAVGQIVLTTALTAVVVSNWGWSVAEGVVLGLAISVASTVVLLRSLMDRDLLQTFPGQAAVGWLIVEDLFTVLVLVMLPALAEAAGTSGQIDPGPLLLTLAITLGKVALLVVLMLIVGVRVVPWLLTEVQRTGSRELFTLAVLTVALGVAFAAAALFGVSFALGAFLAGVVASESDLSQRAAEDALPLSDAFAVLFFVSVGMLFQPGFVLEQPLSVLAIVLLIVLAKPLLALGIVLLLRRPLQSGLVIGAGLGQIGEFSFIMAELGRSLGLLPSTGYSLILAGALISITINPALFALIEPIQAWVGRRPPANARPEPATTAEPPS